MFQYADKNFAGETLFASGQPSINAYHAHGTMLKALSLLRNDEVFGGYLYLHDDMLVSAKKLVEMDPNKVYATKKGKFYSETADPGLHTIEPWDVKKAKVTWDWYKSDYGITALEATMQAYPTFREEIVKCTGSDHGGMDRVTCFTYQKLW